MINKDSLWPTPEDKRDYSHVVVFGALKKEELPEQDFAVSEPLEIKDQDGLDFCAGYAGSAVGEDHEFKLLCPHFTFAMGKKLLGDFKPWGIDLRTIGKVGTKFGFLEQEYCPHCQQGNTNRDEIANWDWITDDHLALAAEHRQNSYFWADGDYDTFDNYRMTLWQNRYKNCSILTGVKWRTSWTGAKDGIIPEEYEQDGYGHAIKIYGQKDGRLVAQLSNGIGIGYGGLFYFPRAVVNKEFNFGGLLWNDMPQAKAKLYSEAKISMADSYWKKFYKTILSVIKSYL